MNEIERRKSKQQEQQQQLQTNTQTRPTKYLNEYNYVKCLNVKINEKMKDNFEIVTSMEKKDFQLYYVDYLNK